MSNAAESAARTERFNNAVRAFTPPSPTRHAKLMPLKEGIVELRQKGASLRLIRELLATVGVAVGTDTIARFLTDVNGGTTRRRNSRRGRGRAGVAATNSRQPVPVPTVPLPSAPPRVSATPEHIESLSERTRTRGPRVADPRNL